MKSGRVVAMFPEGGIRSGKESITEEAEIDDSIVLLAQMANVPVLPILLLGTDHLYYWKNILKRPRILCYMGDYFEIPKRSKVKKDRQEFSQKLGNWFKSSMNQLLEEKITDHNLIPRTAQEHWSNK